MIASNNKIERWFRRHHEKAIRGADGCWFLRKAKEAWSMRRHLSGEMDWGPIHRLWICLRHASHRFHASLPAPWSSNLSRVSSKLCLCPPYGEGNGTPLQYSCLENPMDGGAWKAEVHGSLGVGHDWATSLSLFTFMHWRRKRQPTPVFLPGESQGWRSLVGCHLWGRTELDTSEAT